MVLFCGKMKKNCNAHSTLQNLPQVEPGIVNPNQFIIPISHLSEINPLWNFFYSIQFTKQKTLMHPIVTRITPLFTHFTILENGIRSSKKTLIIITVSFVVKEIFELKKTRKVRLEKRSLPQFTKLVVLHYSICLFFCFKETRHLW